VSSFAEFETQAEVVVSRCHKLASFSEEPGRTTRTFLSAPMRECHREIASWLTAHGVHVSVDAAGNLRALYPAAQANAPRLLIGSHLDTVPNAGAFDGILGVVMGVALIDLLAGERLPFAIEIVGFSEEEGVRFGTPFIGSRALAGTIDDNLLNQQDADGVTMRKAIENFGLDPATIADARISGDVLGYLEFHIEQGPVLDELNLPLATVEAIVGQSRLDFTFIGAANHAGTTPMHLRRDALAGAAEWIAIVEREALRLPGLVATTGSIQAVPGAANVIAGEVRLTLDVRHDHDHARNAAVNSFVQRAEEVAARRKLTVAHRVVLDQPSVPMDSRLVDLIAAAIEKTGAPPHRMVSGAGHDAMILAPVVPSAMTFLRSPGGISHSPEESVRADDVAKALEAGVHLLRSLATSSVEPMGAEPARRSHRA
jgi:allantoate deiminase